MDPKDIAKLRALTGFPALVAYLRDELDWPLRSKTPMRLPLTTTRPSWA